MRMSSARGVTHLAAVGSGTHTREEPSRQVHTLTAPRTTPVSPQLLARGPPVPTDPFRALTLSYEAPFPVKSPEAVPPSSSSPPPPPLSAEGDEAVVKGDESVRDAIEQVDTAAQGDAEKAKADKGEEVSRHNVDGPGVAGPLKQVLVTWLKRLGMYVPPTAQLDDVASDFQTGVLLCDLVERVEKEPIHGIIRRPSGIAHSLHNVNKALEVLRESPTIHARHLFSGDSMARGDTTVIWELLEDMFQEYADRTGSSDLKTRIRAKREGKEKKREKEGPVVSEAHVDDESSSPSHPAVTDPLVAQSPSIMELEDVVRLWLRRLGFRITPHEESGSMLEDPFRNGTLLCELVGLVEGTPIKGVIRKPTTIISAIKNVELALQVLQRQGLIPTELLRDPEPIVRGSGNITWNLLWHIKMAHPRVRPAARKILTGSSRLPYTESHLADLEESLFRWLYELEVMDPTPPPTCFDDVVSQMTTGVLLCDLVMHVEGRRIHGIFRAPKVPMAAVSNLRKALAVFRPLKGMSQRFLWCEEEIARGDRLVITGLLEDIRRYCDGLPPRSTTPRRGEKPYLGRSHDRGTTVERVQPSRDVQEAPRHPESEPTDGLSTREDCDIALVESLTHWLRHMGVVLSTPLSAVTVKDFSDGVLLCRIVEHVVGEDLQGVVTHPRSKAGCLSNVKRALDLLKREPNMPSDYLFTEEEIVHGDGLIITQLLRQIRKVFGSRAAPRLRHTTPYP